MVQWNMELYRKALCYNCSLYFGAERIEENYFITHILLNVKQFAILN